MLEQTTKRVRLGEVFDLQMGKTPARANAAYWGGGHKWISIADIGNADLYISDTKETISDLAVQDSGIRPIPKNTLIMSFKLSIGKVAITAEEMYSNEAIMSFRDIGKCEFDLHYLFHQFKNKDWSNGTNKAVMGATLNKATLKNHEILIPPLAEQKRIAGVLDKISVMKRNAEARVQKLDLLVKSRFVEMFGDPVTNPKGWSIARIEEFADVKIGPFGSVLHKDDYIFGGHALVNPSHMFDGKIVPDESLTLSEERYSELPAYHLRRGDVVVARRGEIGRCALVECDGLFCGTGSMYIRITKNCRPDFLQRVISFPTYAAKLEFGAVGVTMKNINAGMVADSVVPLPPMEVQNEFAAFVEQVEKLKATAQRECEQVDLLYRAKLQEYFG